MDKRRVGEIAAFESAREFERWLAKNHAESTGIWLRFFKKNSSVLSVSYDEALDVAICFGWIDGQLRKYDEKSWLRKFTPRRPKSVWSKRNRAHAERLITGGKMQKRSRAARESEGKAKQDGRWQAAYDSASEMEIPDDFVKELAKNKRAKAFFESLNRANVYAIVWEICKQREKPGDAAETPHATILAILLAKEQKFHD